MIDKMSISVHNKREKEGRQIVWFDDFSELNMEKWGFYHLMNNPASEYSNDSEHIFISDGRLHIRTLNKDGKVSSCDSLTTKERMLYKYGFLEMRAKVPFRHGAWPSLWFLGNTDFHNEDIGWFCEIDLFEVFSSETLLISNIHRWGHDNRHEMLTDSNEERGYAFPDKDIANDEFHIFGFLWDTEYMKFFVDGNCFYQIKIDEQTSFDSMYKDKSGGFHEPIYININNETFSDKLEWYPEGAAITVNDKFPIEYQIDWIRLYQNPNEEIIYLER